MVLVLELFNNKAVRKEPWEKFVHLCVSAAALVESQLPEPKQCISRCLASLALPAANKTMNG